MVVISTFLGNVGFILGINFALTVVIVAVVSVFVVGIDTFRISVVNVISAVVSKIVVGIVVGILDVSEVGVVVCAIIVIGAFNGVVITLVMLLVLVVSFCLAVRFEMIMCGSSSTRNLPKMSNESSIDRFVACETFSGDKFMDCVVDISSVIVSGVDVNGMVAVDVSTNEMDVVVSGDIDVELWIGLWGVVLSIGSICWSKRADFSLL